MFNVLMSKRVNFRYLGKIVSIQTWSHTFPFEFCQIWYMWQIGRKGTKAKKNALQLHPFLSIHDEMAVPRELNVMRLTMNKHLAVPSETSTFAAWQQKSGFSSAFGASAIWFFSIFWKINYKNIKLINLN